tara:strand:- start:13 stop:1038 length:1026 start_codon:yes stop_codon:yes gene_type:complete
MKHTVKWGIIGLGNIAFEFAKSFYNVNNADLIAVASTSHKKLAKFQQEFNIKKENLYDNYEKLTENQNIDIIYIALPNTLHFEWVLKNVEKNKNILVEKPAFLNLKDASIIFKHQNFKDIFFNEGFMYRYHPQIIELIKIIKSNIMGEPISMESSFGINLINKKKYFGLIKKKIDKNNRLFNKALGGGVIFDLGCYTTSMSLLIASMIENININNFKISDVQTQYLDTKVDVHSVAKINFDKKFSSVIKTSFKENYNETIVLCKEGKIILENSWNTKMTSIELVGKINKRIKFESLKNNYSLEIEQISKDILKDKKEVSFPGISKIDTLTNTKIIENWRNG